MKPPENPKIIAVMPAYNAATTLERTLKDIPSGSVDEIILVDDCSKDNTVEIAESLGLTVIRHEKNTGYGGNQKTCYTAALQRGADIVVMIHPDYQYDSRVIPLAAELIRIGNCDVILGSRIRTRAEALQGGPDFAVMFRLPGQGAVSDLHWVVGESIVCSENAT